MSLIDISELLVDPDFATHFKILRTTGVWKGGRFILDSPEELSFYGPVQPPSVKEMEILPEGERLQGIMCFWVKGKDVFLTRDLTADSKAGISDQFLWRGNHYKIIQIMPWSDYGWVKAFGVRMEGK